MKQQLLEVFHCLQLVSTAPDPGWGIGRHPLHDRSCLAGRGGGAAMLCRFSAQPTGVAREGHGLSQSTWRMLSEINPGLLHTELEEGLTPASHGAVPRSLVVCWHSR